ncbi:hypothetical protein [Ferrimicrobium sp.]|uniref:hypothetical protein n=1 Tax=Ferrimicrobium sp. TaxID=2926050 RepID=UPI002630116F|nr:hypothetical protein [Ferrimicrobium sp.]
MVDVEKRKQERDDYLRALYELVDGRMDQWTTHRAIGTSAGIAGGDVFSVGQHLVQEKLCKFETIAGLDGSVSITSAGIAQVEQLDRIDAPRLSDLDLTRRVEAVIPVLLEEVAKEPSLSNDDRRNIETDLQSAQDQLRAPTPNRAIIKAAFRRIQTLWPAIVNVSTVAANVIAIIHGA